MKKEKNVQKMKRKMTALVLVVALVITGTNLNIMSDSIYATQENGVENSKGKEEAVVVRELEDERTENSNTYLMSDGSKKTDIYTENIRYKENGALVEYDSALTALNRMDKKKLNKILEDTTADNYIMVNAKGDSKQYFPKSLDENNGIVMNYKKYVLGFMPVLSKNSRIVPESGMEKNSEESRKIDIFTPTVNEDTVTYMSESSDIKYQYISLTNGVKENIILDSKPDIYEFAFKVDMKKLQMESVEGYGGINLKDTETGKNIGYIMPPNIMDADGKVNYEDVRYVLEETAEGTVLKLVLNKEYFDNENLAYPIQIDPTPVWFDSKLSTAIVCSASVMANSNLHGEELIVNNKVGTSYPFVGSEQRVFLDTSKVAEGNCFIQGPGDIRGKYIEKAELSVTEAAPRYTTGTVEIRKLKDKWDPQTITWKNQPEMEEEVIGSFVCEGVEKTRHSIDLTEWAQGIADGQEDTGLVFTAKEEGSGDGFKGPEVTHQGYMWLSVLYRDIRPYDASVSMEAEYNSESGKIEAGLSDIEDGETEIKEVKLFKREGNENRFQCVAMETTALNKIELSGEGIGNTLDLRICVAYNDGTAKVTNIVSLEKETETSTDENGNDVTEVSYEQAVRDTDGDGLEDGYEIWDFKTKWNTQTGVDKEGNYIYEQDSDGDGFPDGYEVFTLGTDPAVANEENKDSDGDYLDDLTEYQLGTNPWLIDSDFDGDIDSGEEAPTFTNGETDKEKALAAETHIGRYDIEYTVNENGAEVTYIKNIYSGIEKSAKYNYGDSSINKEVLRFYNADNQETATIERINTYDKNSNTQKDKNVICITYAYDENGNNILICDQKTRYNLSYDMNGTLKEIRVGENLLIKNSFTNSTGKDTSDIIECKEESIEYGNGQKKRTVTTRYKEVSTNVDGEKISYKIEIFYDSNTLASYISEFGEDGSLVKFTDNTQLGNRAEYHCTYEKDKTIISRNNNFIITETNHLGDNKNVRELKYSFLNLCGNEDEKTQTIIDNESTEQINIVTSGFHAEQFIYTQDINNGNIINIIKNKNIELFRSRTTNISNNQVSYNTIGKENKNMIYQLNGAGNITSVLKNGVNANSYVYDGHGRLIEETNISKNIGKRYIYNSTGNMTAEWTYTLTKDGKIPTSGGTVKYFSYSSGSWKDLLIAYAGENISYDGSGNPETYRNNYSFSWERGRQLNKVYKSGVLTATYQYNQNGLRTEKITDDEEHTYEWEKTNLIRETIKYKQNNMVYDIWYLYNGNGDLVGFEYSYIDENNQLQSKQVYYEKDYVGNVIAILDDKGNEIVTYEYDTWGNILDYTIQQGGEIPYQLNNIGYKQYYKDKETGFYYLQSRYYDTITHRFLNADETGMLFAGTSEMFEDNLFIYCNGNPINAVDCDGRWYYRYYDYTKYLNTMKKHMMRGESRNINAWTNANAFYNSVKAEVVNNSRHYAKRSGNLYDYINGQHLYPYSKMKYGSLSMDVNGCEIIATYNLMKFLKKYTYFPMLVAEFSINRMQWNFGYFGTNPEKLSKYFKAHDVKFTKYSTRRSFEKSNKKHKYYIVSYWNEYAPSGGIHTVAVRRISDKKFEVYNYDLDIKKTSYIKSIGELYTGDWKQYSCIYGFN